jgi:hypothetical protein
LERNDFFSRFCPRFKEVKKKTPVQKMLSQSDESGIESLQLMFSSLLSGGLITYDDLVQQGFTEIASHLMCSKATQSRIQCEEKRFRRARSPDHIDDLSRLQHSHDTEPKVSNSCLSFQANDENNVHKISSAIEVSRSGSEDRECPLDM